MSIFTKMRSAFTKAASGAKQSFSFISNWVTTSWMSIDFLTLVKQGYKASSAVSACIRALAFSFPEPQLIAYLEDKNGEEQPAGSADPLQKLIRNPNPDMGEAELYQFMVTYAALGGDCYLFKERNAIGQVVGLWPFSKDLIKPIPGKNTLEGIVSHYVITIDGEETKIPKNDIIQWKWLIDPEQPWTGIGGLELCIREVQNDTESSRFAFDMFKNNAIPPVVVTLTEGDELTEEKTDRLRKAWLKRYGGRNRTAPAFLEAGMTVQKLGLNMQELDLSELKNIPESRICAAFGVPPTIALLYVGLKRSDYGDGMARKSYTETTLKALWRSCASEMTKGLSDEFGGGYQLRYDLNQVEALRENLKELWDRLLTALEKGAITRAEFKRGVGMKATEADEVYKGSMIYYWEPAGQAPLNPVLDSSSSSKANRLGVAAPLPLASLGDAKTAEQRLATKGNSHYESKSANAVYGRGLQRIRRTLWPTMSKELDVYFASLSDRVVSRAGKALTAMVEKKDDLPDIDDLLTQKDADELTKLVKKWFVAIAQASWEMINLSIGVDVDFELTDPAITKMLATAGGDIKDIVETTRSSLQDALKYGNENGWSIQQLVNGDENQAGIKDIVEETYKNRSTTIARTELGNAQNAVTAERYKANGVHLVEILDNGDTDDDEPCKVANGQIWTIEFFESNRLEHPSCTRVAVAYFGDATPDRS